MTKWEAGAPEDEGAPFERVERIGAWAIGRDTALKLSGAGAHRFLLSAQQAFELAASLHQAALDAGAAPPARRFRAGVLPRDPKKEN